MQQRLYPIGQQDFPGIISEGKVYVDKTMHAHRLISTNKFYLLSRPRRFGKSLFISTLESVFLGKKELFKGLYIYDRWGFEEYPVLRISFSNIGYRTMGLQTAISKELFAIATNYDVVIQANPKDIANVFKELIKKLHLKYDKGVVILIDEYDKPLIDYLDQNHIHIAVENRNILKTFYSILKDADSHLKFVFITGVSKFSQVSIFSDLNNLIDLTIDLEYNEICGISQKELNENFIEELKLVDKNKMKLWYNGYRWHIKGETVYNPFSLLNFFNKKGDYLNCWYSTGTPTFLMELCKTQKTYDVSLIKLSSFILTNFDIENLQIHPILFQTGYLTLVDFDDRRNIYTLDYPNHEVRYSFLLGLTEVYTASNSMVATKLQTDIEESLFNQDEVLLKNTINLAFSFIPYELWQKDNEHFYHAIVHLIFSMIGLFVDSEVQTKNGRADAIVNTKENIYCLEFKLDKSAEEAMNQIAQKGYTEKYVSQGKTIHHIGVNFNSKKKEVEAIVWKVVP